MLPHYLVKSKHRNSPALILHFQFFLLSCCWQGLDKHAFGGFTLGLALRELFLGACQLRHLPLTLVRDLVALRRLHLWANELCAARLPKLSSAILGKT